MMTKQQIQQQVDKLTQPYLDRMRAAHNKRQAEIQEQIEECERQAELCRKQLMDLEEETR